MQIYAKQVTEPTNSDETGIFRSVKYLNGVADIPSSHPQTVPELFESSVKLHFNSNFLGTRKFNQQTKSFGEYGYLTYDQVHQKVLKVASGLYHLLQSDNLFGDDVTSISLFSVNRQEWWMTDLASGYHSFASVGLFDTFGPQACIYILNHTKSPILVTSQDKIPFILSIADKLEHLKIIISMDSLRESNKAGTIASVLFNWNQSVGKFKLLDYDQLIELGAQNNYPHHLPQSDDILTICYTSGTTGTPKGVMLTHRNFLVAKYIGLEYLDPITTKTPGHISYMPLSHCYERMNQYGIIGKGGRTGFYCGDITKILEDIQAFKPTYISSVPRMLNRICDGIAAKTIHGKGLIGTLFRLGYKAKMDLYLKTGQTTHPIWNPILFSKLKQALGGEVEYISSGSAPLSKEALKFLRVSFSCPVFEGYGSSETSSLVSIAPVLDSSYNNVGAPLGLCEVKLVSVPEMNYFVTDKPYPRGELLIRGTNLFKGYYKDAEKTAEAFDSEGFFKSGDICYINEQGLISIIDRKSSFFKLSQGEFITPERVENMILKHPAIQMAWLTGIGTESSTVAVVVPDLVLFSQWYETKFQQKKFTSISLACSDKEVKRELLDELRNICIKGKIARFEIPSNIHLEPEPFSMETGLLTPTSKICRPKLNDYYKQIIQDLYSSAKNSNQKPRL